MFKPGDIWRHKHCLDIDIEIQKIQYRGPDYWKIKVMYWNRHMKTYAHWDSEIVKIYKTEWPKWKLVNLVNEGMKE